MMRNDDGDDDVDDDGDDDDGDDGDDIIILRIFTYISIGKRNRCI